MGFESLAVDEARAVSFPQGVVPFTSLLTYSLVAVDKPIEKPETIKRLILFFTGLSERGLIPSDGRQNAIDVGKDPEGGSSHRAVVTVDLQDPSEVAGKTQRPAPAGDFAEYLRPTFEAQSNDPRIRKTARSIVGDEPDVYRAAVLINRWVHENVKKKFVDTFSAVATLESLEGECQSHTSLFAALARASGIPTRTVSGIVYSQQFNGFLYHAWPEIHAGSWIAMDPTFGQDVADATHVKLIEGELSTQLKLFEFIGKIGINVMNVDR